jgi:hypothetical protein
MGESTKEGGAMRRRKRFIIKLVALGLSVAAISASPVQARLDEGLGVPKQSEPTLVISPEDRTAPWLSPAPASQPSRVSNDDDLAILTLGVTGIILALGAGVAWVAVYEARKHKPARA